MNVTLSDVLYNHLFNPSIVMCTIKAEDLKRTYD